MLLKYYCLYDLANTYIPLGQVELQAFDSVLCRVGGAGRRPGRAEVHHPFGLPGNAAGVIHTCVRVEWQRLWLRLGDLLCWGGFQAAEEAGGLFGPADVAGLITNGLLEVLQVLVGGTRPRSSGGGGAGGEKLLVKDQD